MLSSLLTKFTMHLAVYWCSVLSISILAAFPGQGPGLQEHPGGYTGVVRDRMEHLWSALKNKCFWYTEDYNEEVYDAMDWTLGMAFHEEINDLQGLDYQSKEDLRHKRLSKVAELLVIVIMAAACLTVIRLTLKRKFPGQNKKPKLH